MLRQLRRKFIVIVMALVGTVLVAVLGSTYLATRQTQQQILAGSLERALYGEMDERPTIGVRPPNDGRMGGMLALLVEIDDDGVVLQVANRPVNIDATVLADVVERVLAGEGEGKDPDAHVAWASLTDDEGDWRIALVDTTASDTMLRQQAIKDLQIVAIALAALFAISWWLSAWALRPVEEAEPSSAPT